MCAARKIQQLLPQQARARVHAGEDARHAVLVCKGNARNRWRRELCLDAPDHGPRLCMVGRRRNARRLPRFCYSPFRCFSHSAFDAEKDQTRSRRAQVAGRLAQSVRQGRHERGGSAHGFRRLEKSRKGAGQGASRLGEHGHRASQGGRRSPQGAQP